MYKAIKDEKIISISDTDNEFLYLIRDEVIEDKDHTSNDYAIYGNEYLLKEDIPVPTKEEMEKARKLYRQTHIDDNTLERSRKMVNGTWTQENENAYLALDAEVTAYVEEHFPYPKEEKPSDQLR